MSMHGLIQMRGSTVTIRRSAKVQLPDGTFNQSWSNAIASTHALIEAITSDLSQRIWGQNIKATHRAYMYYGSDVKEGDGVQVVTGAYANSTYRVASVLARDMSAASRYLEIAFESTPETF